MSTEQNIISLRKTGLSYQQIANQLGCSKSLITYYCSHQGKYKHLQRTRKRRAINHPYISKYEDFIRQTSIKPNKQITLTITKLLYDKLRRFTNRQMNITKEQLIAKIGTNPKCYLTGDEIDINSPRTYQFDHIIPRSRGGDNSLDNLGICTRQANLSKSDMTPDEYINHCKKVLQNAGYVITKS